MVLDTITHDIPKTVSEYKGVEHVICDVTIRHCINIVSAAILQFVSY